MADDLDDDDLGRLAEFIDSKDVDEFLDSWRDGAHKKAVVYAWSDASSLLLRLLNLSMWNRNR
jgi:hypothetical protein